MSTRANIRLDGSIQNEYADKIIHSTGGWGKSGQKTIDNHYRNFST